MWKTCGKLPPPIKTHTHHTPTQSVGSVGWPVRSVSWPVKHPQSAPSQAPHPASRLGTPASQRFAQRKSFLWGMWGNQTPLPLPHKPQNFPIGFFCGEVIRRWEPKRYERLSPHLPHIGYFFSAFFFFFSLSTPPPRPYFFLVF
jgi:hypothetical protein